MPASDSSARQPLGYARRTPNPFWQVLLTYLRRPAFRVLAAATVGWYLLWISQYQRSTFSLARHWVLAFLVTFLLAIWSIALLPAFMAVLVIHVKEQIGSVQASVAPGFRRPHLAVAGTVFLVAAVGTTCGLWAMNQLGGGRGTSLLGLLAIVLTLMVAAAWLASLRFAWTSLLLVPLVLLALNDRHVRDIVAWLTSDIPSPRLSWKLTHPQIWSDYYVLVLRAELTRLGVLAVDLVAFWALLRRLAAFGPARTRAQVSPRGVPRAVKRSAAKPRSRRPRSGLLARAWHRRLAVLPRGAAWLVALFLAAVLIGVGLLLNSNRAGYWSRPIENADALRSWLLATILPGVAVGVVWMERRPLLAYESLYPAGRGHFIAEAALALAADLAQFWLALSVAALAPLAIWDRFVFVSPLLAPTLASAAMMQVMWFGAIFWATRLRSWTPYLAVLGLLALATAIPLDFAWSPHPALGPHGLLLTAIGEMTCGLFLLAAGLFAWHQGELA